MFGIAKALIDAKIQPDNTILICAMAAEEWGVIDSDFDWSTGAYEQVFTAHPEWVGKVIADLNFELPARHTEPVRGSEAVMNISHFWNNFWKTSRFLRERIRRMHPWYLRSKPGPMTFRWRSQASRPW